MKYRRRYLAIGMGLLLGFVSLLLLATYRLGAPPPHHFPNEYFYDGIDIHEIDIDGLPKNEIILPPNYWDGANDPGVLPKD